MTQSIYSTYADKYSKQTSAEALFFHSSIYSYVKGLRILLPDKGIEFTDNSYIGTGAFNQPAKTWLLITLVLLNCCQDPAGFFYYNDLDTAKTANKYVSDNTRNPKDNQLIAWVKLYKDNTIVAEVCHVFLQENILITQSFIQHN